MKAELHASIDIGTNSVRLLVAEPVNGPERYRIVERLMRITRLGRGVDAAGTLGAGVGPTVAVLDEYAGVLDRLGVDRARVRVATTSASRDATDRDAFLARVEQAVGVRPALISGDEEGRLSFLGATAGLDPAEGPFLVVDIGGGSTELAVGTTECEGVVSIDVGCVRLTERYLRHDPPEPEELLACISVTQAYLDDVRRALPAVDDARRFVGLAGTITTVAAIEQGIAEYARERIHHFELTREAAEDVFRTLATEPLVDRVHNPGLEAGRADVIVGGCCVLVALFRSLGFDSLLVSEADILDGLVLSGL